MLSLILARPRKRCWEGFGNSIPLLEKSVQEQIRAWSQWLMPVILAIQEAEIRRIAV
jgi:hypothetical protein